MNLYAYKEKKEEALSFQKFFFGKEMNEYIVTLKAISIFKKHELDKMK